MEKTINKAEYVCAICQELAIRPHVTVPCQHIFCELCLPIAFTSEKEKPSCPVCRGPVSTVMHDRMSQQLLLQFFGDTIVECNVCDTTHPYADTVKCGSPEFVYIANENPSAEKVSPSKRTFSRKEVVVARATPGRAMLDFAFYESEELARLSFQRDGKQILALMESFPASKHSLTQLKSMTMHLYKLPGKGFHRDRAASEKGIDYVSTQSVEPVDNVTIVNAYDALMAEPDVVLLGKKEMRDILTKWVWDRFDAETAKKRKLNPPVAENTDVH